MAYARESYHYAQHINVLPGNHYYPSPDFLYRRHPQFDLQYPGSEVPPPANHVECEISARQSFCNTQIPVHSLYASFDSAADGQCLYSGEQSFLPFPQYNSRSVSPGQAPSSDLTDTSALSEVEQNIGTPNSSRFYPSAFSTHDDLDFKHMQIESPASLQWQSPVVYSPQLHDDNGFFSAHSVNKVYNPSTNSHSIQYLTIPNAGGAGLMDEESATPENGHSALVDVFLDNDGEYQLPKSGQKRRRASSNSASRKRHIRSRTCRSSEPAQLQRGLYSDAVPSARKFPCAFHKLGCMHEFPSKNEWKRHVAFQHLQLGFYRCDLVGCRPEDSSSHTSRIPRSPKQISSNTCAESVDEVIIPSHNDFNRKDLFTQHCRRMHGPTRVPELCTSPILKKGLPNPSEDDVSRFEETLADIRKRCWRVRRKAPARSICPICSRLFDKEDYKQGTTRWEGEERHLGTEERAWEERMEHLGKHYERGQYDKDAEELDPDLVEWCIEHELVRENSAGKLVLANVSEPSSDRPERRRRSTNSKTTNLIDSGRPLWKSGVAIKEEQSSPRRQPTRAVVARKIERERRVKAEVYSSDDAEYDLE